MPQNQRESLIYTVMMCFFMIVWMSVYNVSWMHQEFSPETIQIAWAGVPFAYIYAILWDWFVVGKIVKKAAFRWFLRPDSSPARKVITISTGMVILMCTVMSFYGAAEACVHTGAWGNLLGIWLTNIPRNFVMALPVQLLIAGPLIRFLFRKAFPEGKVLP